MKRRWLTAALTLGLLAGCTVGPKYRKPVVEPPNVFRGSATSTPPADPASLADLRRATEAARADLLAAEENRRAVVTTLVGDVSTAYFNLLELDAELEIAEQTLASREESLRLIRTRERGSVATLLDVRQAEQLVYNATQTRADLERRIEQTENQISLLLGASPAEIARGRELIAQEQPPAVPPGLPSALLERRPDIRAAEQNLIAANAIIGVAKAAYFPQISLTGFVGGQSNQLGDLLGGPSRVWSFVPQATQPIFTAGRLKSNVKLTEAQQQMALALLALVQLYKVLGGGWQP